MESITITKLIRTGTSLCVVIPKAFTRALNIQRGDQLVLRAISPSAIIIYKISDEEIQKLKISKDFII